MDQVDHDGSRGVILEAPANNKKTREPLAAYWCFTLNNYTEDHMDQLDQVFRHECNWFVFQEEIGKKCGTPHLQGTIYLKQRQRRSALSKIEPKIHWEPTKSIKASLAYSSKEETRKPNGLQWVYGIELPKPIKVKEPYGWQLDVLEIIKEEPDERTIHWFWETTGGVGKTTLCRYLVHKHNALMLTGKSNDMYNMIAKYPNKRELIVVDCPRCQQDYMNYGAVEQIKNGLLFSGKYEGAQVLFNHPHVIVFANKEPDYESMSMDRWDVRKISID